MSNFARKMARCFQNAALFVGAVLFSIPGFVSAQEPIACPIAGLQRGLIPGCAMVEEIQDPDGHFGVKVGDTPQDGICIRSMQQMSMMESVICGSVAAGDLKVKDGAAVVKFSLLLMSGSFGQLRQGIELTEKGFATLRIDAGSRTLVITAEGKYTRVSQPGSEHPFRATLSIPMRKGWKAPTSDAAAQGSGDRHSTDASESSAVAQEEIARELVPGRGVAADGGI